MAWVKHWGKNTNSPTMILSFTSAFSFFLFCSIGPLIAKEASVIFPCDTWGCWPLIQQTSSLKKNRASDSGEGRGWETSLGIKLRRWSIPVCALSLKTQCTFGPISTYKEPVYHECYKHGDKFSQFQTGMHLSKRSSVLFFFRPCHAACRSSFPNQGLKVWECRVLTTEPSGKFQRFCKCACVCVCVCEVN